MAEWALQVMRLHYGIPLLDPGITFAIFVIALKLIGRHYSPISGCIDSI
jgi:hypothetical protein